MDHHYSNCPGSHFRKIAPTILLDVPEDSRLMQEEIFGPLMPIQTVSTINTFKYIFLCGLSQRDIV